MKTILSNLKVIGITLLIIVFSIVLHYQFNIKDKHIVADYYWNREFGLYIKLDENENGHGRVTDSDEIGWNDKFIATKMLNEETNETEYRVIEISKDDPLLNSNEIVTKPLSRTEFEKYNTGINKFKKLK